MAKKRTNTGVIATLMPSGKPDMAAAMEVIKQESAALETIATTVFKTSGQLDGFPKNVKEETNVETLISMYSSVKRRSDQYYEDAAEVGVTKVPVKRFGNGTKEDWQHDVQLRIKIINTEARRKQLQEITSELKDLMSREQKQSIVMSKIAKLASGETTSDEEIIPTV